MRAVADGELRLNVFLSIPHGLFHHVYFGCGKIESHGEPTSFSEAQLVGQPSGPSIVPMGLSYAQKMRFAFTLMSTLHLFQMSYLAMLQQRGNDGIKRRRGGWHPKPRQGRLYGRAEEGAEAWEHDAERSVLWIYINSPEEKWYDKRFHQVIGIPRKLWRFYVALAQEAGFGERDDGDPRRGRRPQPIEMKVSAWLLVLHEGVSFEHAAWVCCVSEPVVRRFFHAWNAWLVKHEYPKHVYPPSTEHDIQRTEAKFAKMGYPGAITTIDATHVEWLQCPAMHAWRCTGKDGYPTRSYNCAIGPNKEFHHVHRSHPGAQNDKTIARFDPFMQGFYTGRLYGQRVFRLRTVGGGVATWSGLYAIVDGGYHAWSRLQFPNKKSAMASVMRCFLSPPTVPTHPLTPSSL